jgi:uncharacterized protein (TIGR02996 family)
MTEPTDLLASFLDDIVAHPEDPSLWLILADWLEDREDPRAELLRLTWQLQHEKKHRQFKRRQARVQELLAGGMLPVVPKLVVELELEFAWIPPGSFVMGSLAKEVGRDRDEKRHPVTLTRGFWMGVHAITQGQWRALMGDNPSSFSKGGQYAKDVTKFSVAKVDRFPVDGVSWNTATEFCRRLGERLGRTVTLPTEAQWEYACRAGTTTIFHFGNIHDGSQANSDATTAYGSKKRGKYLSRTQPVGSYPPNAFGLYDMHGNVWEWCLDFYREDYQKLPAVDPLNLEESAVRVQRGGCGILRAPASRAANRRSDPADHHTITSGVRVVLPA